MTAPTFRGHVRAALADALALVLPVTCAGCDAPDVTLCEPCRHALSPAPVETSIEGLRVVSGLAYAGVTARVLRSLKEDGRTGLARDLAPALAAALDGLTARGAVVVAVPTSRASFRRRGYRVAELVARRAGLPVAGGLSLVRQPRDQRGLDARARRENVFGAMIARGTTGRSVVLVDDVVTTGATLLDAARALRADGAHVVGAATIAATPRMSPDPRRMT